MNQLLCYLEKHGILLCNQNPLLPSLEDIGCSWSDVVELIDNHQLFYCKVFQKRTTYLSAEAYYLLKQVRTSKPLPPEAEQIYSLLLDKPPVDTTFLKEVSHLSSKSYRQGFDFLLQNLSVTALANGKNLAPNWSTFLYGTAEAWEQTSPNRFCCDHARDRLWEIFSSTMPEKLFRSLIR